MKKYYIQISCLIATLFLWSCDTLDIENLDSYNADKVWGDEKLATAYVTNLYADVFISENQAGWNVGADSNSEQVGGIPFYKGTITVTGTAYKKWEYTKIRLINEAIRDIEAGGLSQNIKNELTAQCLFMRAFMYFPMIVHHGGMPYLKIAQDKDKDDLMIKRNSTIECFDFMIKDLDDAIAMLPDKISSSSADYGRIDKVFAKAFKAKVLLQKASPQFNPSNPYTNIYWQEAYLAAKEAYDFSIANGADLTPKYTDIWAIEKGKEVIFSVIYTYPNKTAAWERYTRPSSFSVSANSAPPTWNFIQAFPMKDGKKYNDPTGQYYVATEKDLMQCFWKNRDPRFENLILHSGVLYPVAGASDGFRHYTSLGLAEDDDAYGTNPKAGTTSTKNGVLSGFYNRKAENLSLRQAEVANYDFDYIYMRFAEVMMIYAETANETGRSDITLDMLKKIRHRAGIEIGDGSYGLPAVGDREGLRQAILDERNIEFCFEGHRFWDLRRTRNMVKNLSGLQKFGLEAIAINSDGTDMDMALAKGKAKRYELTPENFRYVKQMLPYNPNAENTFVVEESFYFFPIQKSKIDENSNLEQNNNWGGTFNPTLE